MNFTKEGRGISSYLAFRNINLIDRIDSITSPFGISVPRVLSLFRNLKMQERRSGFMFGTLRRRCKWIFESRTPLMYQIRNFFLSDAERKAIQNEPIFDDDDPDTDNEDEVKKFARKHLISDRLGIGDTRLNIGYAVTEKPGMFLSVGLESTLPTAFSFKKGLYGSHFKQDNNHPPFDLLTIFNLVFATKMQNTNQAIEITKNFLVGALDKLSSILIEAPLGNRGHVGLGIFAEHYLCVTPKLTFYTRGVLEYLVPSVEKRFYIFKKNREEFMALNTDSKDEDSTQVLSFLNDQLIKTLYPCVIDTVVHPGFTFKLNTALSGTMGCNWQLMLGHDLWWQQKEKLGKLKVPRTDREKVRKDIAVKPGALQSKLFGSINYLKSGKTRDWCLSFHGDSTVLGSGIGQDFNLAIRFELFW